MVAGGLTEKVTRDKVSKGLVYFFKKQCSQFEVVKGKICYLLQHLPTTTWDGLKLLKVIQVVKEKNCPKSCTFVFSYHTLILKQWSLLQGLYQFEKLFHLLWW